MNGFLLWIVTALYAAQAAIWFVRGDNAGALILGGYVVANLGLIARG